MNRQAANYIESVGDPMPRAWQTNKHNWIWLGITLSAFISVFIFFWFFNRTSLETATISLTEQNERNRIIKSTIYLTYAQVGDFDFSANGEVSYNNPKNCWERFWSPASCQLFAENYYDQDKIVAEDKPTALNLEGYDCPPRVNKDSAKFITDKKDYYRYSDLLFNVKFKSSLINPLKTRKVRSIKQLGADLFRFEERTIVTHKDTVSLSANMHLYGRRYVDIQEHYDSSFTEDSRLIHKNTIVYKPYTVFADVARNTRDLYLFHIRRYLRMTNRTCCNLHIQSIEFPCNLNCRFVLSFSSPVYFDKLSIEPDEVKPHEIIYSSPEKIKALAESGLYVYARDVSANNQEMLNFFLATLLGILISYVIEFGKRLYVAQKDKKFLKETTQGDIEQKNIS